MKTAVLYITKIGKIMFWTV